MSDTHAAPYRPDIDGLRAIAVLAVIVYHASPLALPGGFVGVDLFFVISGFLISGILFREADSGGIDLFDFYVRRIRRIVPALTVVLIAVAVFGSLALTNLDFQELQRHLAAGSVFVSNLVLWNEAGYFDAPSKFKPLVHLWSLGIEEQFYLFWPPVVLYCTRRRWSIGRLAVIVVALSFLLNVAMVYRSPITAFYMPATRMWELLLGALLALPRGEFARRALEGSRTEVVAWAGLLAIGVAFATMSGAAFPGWKALVPTVGAMALIAAGPGAFVNRRILAMRPLVAIGLISYPLYLWHWPLLSFLQIVEGGAPTNQMKAMAIALAFVLATATYWLIERPIRRSLSIKTPLRIGFVAASLLLVGAVTLYGSQTQVIEARTPNLLVGFYSRVEAVKDPACQQRFPTAGEYCQEYSPSLPVTTALIGDSHAAHFLDGVGAYLAGKGENVVHLGHSGCPPLLDLQRISDNRLGETNAIGVEDTCVAADNSVIQLLASDPAIRRVIISFNGARPLGEGATQTPLLAGTLLPPDESVRISMQRTVERLLQANKSVWLILQVPELGFHPAECVHRPFSLGGAVRTPCAVKLASAQARQALYRQVVESVKKDVPALNVFDPWQWLCDREWCHAEVNHELLYSDDNHLSREGSMFFARRFTF